MVFQVCLLFLVIFIAFQCMCITDFHQVCLRSLKNFQWTFNKIRNFNKFSIKKPVNPERPWLSVWIIGWSGKSLEKFLYLKKCQVFVFRRFWGWINDSNWSDRLSWAFALKSHFSPVWLLHNSLLSKQVKFGLKWMIL